MALVSRSYHDDAGTEDAGDDADYDTLEKTLKSLLHSTRSIRYEMDYTAFRRNPDGSITVDVHYKGSFEIDGVGTREVEDENRFVLVEEDGELKFLSGM